MNYVKPVLSALAAIIIAIQVIPGPGSFLVGIKGSKATGLGAVIFGLAEDLVSPLFWALTLLIFALFYGASKLGNQGLRVLLFWIPTVAVSVLSVTSVAMVAYFLLIRFRQH
jgi:hypothetical protein